MERREAEARLGVLRTSVMPMLEYSQRELRDYTVHGPAHSENVEKLLVEIISRCNRRRGACRISQLGRYILICAAWLHDIGNIVARDAHNRTTCEIIDRLAPSHIEGLHPNYIELVKWVCLAHSRDCQIRSVPPQTAFRSETVRLRFLASVFRIADAADMDSRRAPAGVYEVLRSRLPRKSDRIWRSYQAVRDVSFLQSGSSIIVTVKDKRKASSAVKEFMTEFDEVRDILESHDFPYNEVIVVRESQAPYRGRTSLP
jgi:exopolyphosphatase/pppGpp-phosphohydrolase